MKKRFLKVIAVVCALIAVMSFASPALAYAQWPNADWNQKTLGIIKQGEKNVGKVILLQWHCYAAKASIKSKEMPKSHVDGKYGSRTLQYVKNYQLKKGLKADGVAGNSTYNKMKNTMSSVTADPSKGYVIYDTNDTLKVPKTSRHTKVGNWFTYNRNGKDVNIILKK